MTLFVNGQKPTTAALRLACIALLLFIPWFVQAQSQDNPPIRFGVLPYLSSQSLVKVYRPLAKYLEERLDTKVVIVTAPDFATFAQRTHDGRYDFVFTAPHFAQLAISRHGFTKLSRFERQLAGELVVAANSSVKSISDLRGHVVATPDRLAIVTILGEQLLQDNNLVLGKDVFIKYTPSHNNAIISVADGKAAAGVAVGGLFENMSSNVRDKLSLLTNTKKIPHSMFIASPTLGPNRTTQLRETVLRVK